MTSPVGLRRLWIAAALLLVGSCGGGDSPTDPNGNGDGNGNGDPDNGAATRVVKALALSPPGFPASFDQLPSFMSEAAGFPDPGIVWNGAWRDDVVNGTDAGTPPGPSEYLAQQAGPLDYTPVVVFGWRSDETLHLRVPDNPVNDWSNEQAVALYLQMVEAYAAEYQPPLLFLGNESDHYYDQDPVDYARWVEVFEAGYARIKSVSPATLVGPIFQYERMAGIGVLAGTPDPWEESSWGALTAHDLDQLDMVGLTLYPFFAHETPDQVPDDYLDPIASRIGSVPLAITETGWPAEHAGDFQPPWEASETHQVTYLETLERVLGGHPLLLTTWLFLHPPVASAGGLSGVEWSLFQSLSLRDSDGAARPVYEAWENAAFSHTELSPGPS